MIPPTEPFTAGLRPLALSLSLIGALLLALPTGAYAQTGPSGLPLPRFVSLKSDRVNVRAGPGQDHRVAWIFSRAGLPVEIVAEFGNWRRIRDSEGAEGWVFHSLLSGRRTAVIRPWANDGETTELRAGPSEGAAAVAIVEPGVLAELQRCDGAWCEVGVASISGWVRQEALWGAYPKEVVR